MKTGTTILEIAAKLLAALAAIAVVALTVHVTADVTMRALFRQPLKATIIYVSNYYMVLVVCLPLALVSLRKAHISVDVVTDLFPAAVRRHLDGWISLFSAGVFGLVAVASLQEATLQMHQGAYFVEGGVRITLWYGYFAVPLGYGAGALYMFVDFLLYLARGDRTATPDSDSGPSEAGA